MDDSGSSSAGSEKESAMTKMQSDTTNVTQLAKDFSQIEFVDTAAQVEALEGVVDNMLARLEELCSVTDQVRTQSKEVLFVTLPCLFSEAEKLREIFQQIDNLERFINVIKRYVNEMYEEVQIAEKEFGNKNMKKIWSSLPSFLTRKPNHLGDNVENGRTEPWKRPPDFKVDAYIVKSMQPTQVLEDGIRDEGS